MNMTWKEFKARVESELERQGLTEDVVIRYIDISGSDKEIDVVADEPNCVSIF